MEFSGTKIIRRLYHLYLSLDVRLRPIVLVLLDLTLCIKFKEQYLS
jgi:hypothetical protein